MPITIRTHESPLLSGCPRGQLRVRGRLTPGVAIVGARRADPYGLDLAARLAQDVVDAGQTVISGGALGIDAAASRAALRAGGRATIILGSGLDRPSPKAHLQLFEEAAARGALASPFPDHQRAARWTFPKRNAWIAGLARAVLIVQASAKSGALQTARAALELGRPVWIAPGPMDSPLHRGCHLLIAEGARLLTHPGAWRDAAPEPAHLEARIPVEGLALWRAAGVEPQPLDALARGAGVSAREAALIALQLEIEGHLQAAPGGRYRRA